MSASSTGPRTGLLILPGVSPSASRQVLLESYKQAIRKALTALRRESSNSTGTETTRLDVAVITYGQSVLQRHMLFSSMQKLFANLYTIVCHIATHAGVELDFNGGVDVRVFAVDDASSLTSSPNPSGSSTEQTCAGPLASAQVFSASRMRYTHCWALEPAASNPTFKSALDTIRQSASQHGITIEFISPSSSVKQSKTDLSPSDSQDGRTLHTRVAVGGTFDHLHIGHKLLLTATVFVAEPCREHREITIGITGDELLVNKKHADVLESWDARQQRVAEFVESILVFHEDIPSIRVIQKVDNPGPNGKVVRVTYQPKSDESGVTINYTQISDPFGPTITDESISALIISAETRAGGKAVNDKRLEKGWKALEVFEVDVLDSNFNEDEDIFNATATKTGFESKISSTEIRKRLASSGLQ